MPKESILPRKTTFATTDTVRMVVGGISSEVRASDFASGIESELTSITGNVKVRATTGAGSITSTDNVVTTDGTYSLSMPNPSLVWDATNSKSNRITIAQKGSGTITIDRYSTDQFYNGDGSPSNSYSLSGGAYVSFVTDGTDWIVVGA